MTTGLVGQGLISTFVTPVNGASPIDANVVKGNDNTAGAAVNTHISDQSVHFQSSTNAARPTAIVAGVGAKWIDNDTDRVYYSDGSAWHEIAYLPTGGGTISGNMVITGTLEVDGNLSVNTNKFTVAAASGNTVVAGTLGVTGTLSIGAPGSVVGAASGSIVLPNSNSIGLRGANSGATGTYNIGLVSAANVVTLGDGTTTTSVLGTAVSIPGTLGVTGLLTASVGVTITDGPLDATRTASGSSVFIARPTHAAYTGASIASVATRAASAAYQHFFASSNGVTVAQILGDGSASFSAGVTVSAGGITATGNSMITGTLGGITTLTVTGASLLGDRIRFTANASTTGVGSVYKSATLGLVLETAIGSSNDFEVISTNTLPVLFVPTGTENVQFAGRAGFNNTAPIAKPTVTGAKGGNAALGSLMTALAAYGLVTDSTTA